ncbi:GAF sensor signal transduction histidine kinase [Sulfurimonas gotlandica GD1]|uniref:histidine kinase n=1 Tax=Sulfurimonas gotlandica (strain DSM 19862 / JCM 16533 / GD1) TaxID=929558 RepID=H1FSX5_SULGG|nr:PAS domain-containing sensor histidine kinase [Sulfurimonas gotlandica]EHP28711.1 GAF sensor signal transduction histidine kinase [Sulfurimonas gotlandica GD1]
MMHSNESILRCKNIEVLDDHVAIYNNYNTNEILFFIEKNNFEILFGMEIEEDNINNGINLVNIIHPDDIDLFCISNPADITHQRFQLNFRIIRPDKHVIILKGIFNIILEHDLKNTTIFQVQLNDVRCLNANNNDLSTVKINFEAMMKHTNDFIFFKDANHVLTASSDSLAIITGYKKGSDIIGKIDYELFPFEHAEVYYKLEKEIYKGNIPHIEEVQPFTDENGNDGWVNNRKYPIKNAQGDIIGLFGIARIVTQDIKNQNKIKEQKQQLEKAQHIAHIGSWTLDVVNNKLFWSDEVYNIFEKDKNNINLSYDTFLASIHPDDKEVVSTAFLTSIQNKTSYDTVHRLLLDGERVKYVHEKGEHKFDTNGNIISSFGTVQDITNIKEYENEIRQKDEIMIAQSRLAAMGEMISMIAHQWRQPLAAIGVCADTILVDIELETSSEEETIKLASAISSQTQHLSKTIDDFRNFFKLENEKENESVINVLNNAIDLIMKSLKDQEITCKVNSQTDEKITIFSRELLQVFINILNNAKYALAEYRHEDRKIEIEIKDINGAIVTKIYNNGGQIEQDNLNKIFEPYFSTKEEKNGTGLGLYMCKMIIEQHMNGKLLVENIDEGVCFSIHIPKDK